MRDEEPSRAEGPGLDDEGQPARWWSRLLFQSRPQSETEYRLGLVVVGIAVLLAFYVWGSVIPQVIGNLALGLVNFLSWIGSLFSGGGTQEAAAPVLTPGPTVGPLSSPSPSPLPSPFVSPSPSPIPR